jgi:membrane associated rhomboid family serine protease
MQQPPSPFSCLRYPVTTLVTVAAVIGTIHFMSDPQRLDPLMSNTGDCLREPWRLLVPALFHEGIIHLLFNLYWLWVFGTKIEGVFGHLSTLIIYAILGVGSMAAELALFRGGVGLSGVGYGLFGLLWVLSRTDPRFRDMIDHSVVELMLGWLLVCIVLTMADVWHVGNVAHCAGCVLGALLGWTIGAPTFFRKLRNAAVFLVVFALLLAGGTNIARYRVNLVNDAGFQLSERACRALYIGDTERAIDFYKKALDANPVERSWWISLAKAYRLAGKETEANDAERHAEQLIPQKPASR